MRVSGDVDLASDVEDLAIDDMNDQEIREMMYVVATNANLLDLDDQQEIDEVRVDSSRDRHRCYDSETSVEETHGVHGADCVDHDLMNMMKTMLVEESLLYPNPSVAEGGSYERRKRVVGNEHENPTLQMMRPLLMEQEDSKLDEMQQRVRLGQALS